MTTLLSIRDFDCRPRKPSHQRLRERASKALERSGYRSLARIECRIDERGTVTLLGSVPSFYLKQMAQELVLRCADVSGVENSLSVS